MTLLSFLVLYIFGVWFFTIFLLYGAVVLLEKLYILYICMCETFLYLLLTCKENFKTGDIMEDFEDENQFFDSEVESGVSFNEDDDEEDPEGSAFMRGVEEAVQIRDEPLSEDEDL